jgi:hypothetical protein
VHFAHSFNKKISKFNLVSNMISIRDGKLHPRIFHLFLWTFFSHWHAKRFLFDDKLNFRRDIRLLWSKWPVINKVLKRENEKSENFFWVLFCWCYAIALSKLFIFVVFFGWSYEVEIWNWLRWVNSRAGGQIFSNTFVTLLEIAITMPLRVRTQK